MEAEYVKEYVGKRSKRTKLEIHNILICLWDWEVDRNTKVGKSCWFEKWNVVPLKHWDKILGFNVVGFVGWVMVESKKVKDRFISGRKPILQDLGWDLNIQVLSQINRWWHLRGQVWIGTLSKVLDERRRVLGLKTVDHNIRARNGD